MLVQYTTMLNINSGLHVFFKDLQNIPVLLSNSLQRLGVLNQLIGKNVPHSTPTRWKFNIRMVNVIYDFQMECMKHLQVDSNAMTCKKARGALFILEDSNFTFWLTVFHYIELHAEVLCNQLKKNGMNSTKAKNLINNLEKKLITFKIKQILSYSKFKILFQSCLKQKRNTQKIIISLLPTQS